MTEPFDESTPAETMHAHTHKHADGTVHNHYHTHPNGNVPHEHDDITPHDNQIAYDSTPEDHASQVLPVHIHDNICEQAAPLQASELSYAYPHTHEDVFSELSLQTQAGCMLAVLGNNGAGKSTLLDLLAGITKPRKGKVLVVGDEISSLSRRQVAQRIAYVAQQQTIPHLSVYDEVLLGRKPHVSWSITEHDRQIVAHCIASLQLDSFAERFCDELSGGERQKVFIARALAQEPQILILDEPTSALDPKNQLEVLDAIRTITHEQQLATILVLHDINLALRFCNRFMLMRDGRVIASGDHENVTEDVLSETYDTAFKLIGVDGVRVAVPRMRP